MISLKHKIRSRIRKLFYLESVQNFLCFIVVSYIKLVYKTSKKIFINRQQFESYIDNNQPVIITLWHSRIMMAAQIGKNAKNRNNNYKFLVLASKHGDGMLVSKVMSKFELYNVSGSSSSGNKTGRGITFSGMREILTSLKSGMSFAITPDGPRGPKYKIKGQVINIAKISGVPILPASYSCSKNIILKSWDEFMIPLPFSKLCYYFGDLIWIDKNAKDEEIEKIKQQVEDEVNLAMQKADQMVS